MNPFNSNHFATSQGRRKTKRKRRENETQNSTKSELRMANRMKGQWMRKRRVESYRQHSAPLAYVWNIIFCRTLHCEHFVSFSIRAFSFSVKWCKKSLYSLFIFNVFRLFVPDERSCLAWNMHSAYGQPNTHMVNRKRCKRICETLSVAMTTGDNDEWNRNKQRAQSVQQTRKYAEERHTD